MTKTRSNKRKPTNRAHKHAKSWQPHDTFFRQAKATGYVARSVFKLQQIDERYRLIQPSHRVLDLGCAPGSWLQYIAKKLNPHQGGCVVGIDLKHVTLPAQPHMHLLQQDVFTVPAQTLLLLGQNSEQPCPFDAVLSDMAPNTCGVKLVDQQRSLQLCEQVLQLACQLLKQGGSMCVKLFDGADTQDYCSRCKALFQHVCIQRPQATRSSSKEIYVVAAGFQPGGGRSTPPG
ncbi:MAG: RlmE family RNA methyltransferase [Myxococcota bacterium]